ncbi:MFS transporter [Piscinibacter sakaiensis]|uniref:Major facilitator superfamily (MFS) profile domain-containing protein n=1 Tax=Piscinibacter sakaiensis TaxID=1547922 RepID=A0A0K8P655_PISS1|nr:MFS transporter [Piscinibacter sakaiensis]GAP38086.1 hypothetical protein ISF6_4280 [Piscinibacter sakaiensis]
MRLPAPWPRVLLLYLCGLAAAAQLGKLAALAPAIAQGLALPLTTLALAISLLEAGGALFGAVAGRAAARVGLRPCLRGGMAALALAGLGASASGGAVGLIGWRLLEAAGYLGVIVSAPVLIAREAAAHGARCQALALTLWSTFVPVGLAAGAAAAAALGEALGWRLALAAGGGFALLLALGVARAPLADPAPAADADADADGAGAGPAPPAGGDRAATWGLCLGFGAFALFEVGVLGLLPTLLVEQAGLGVRAAGQWTALAALSAVLGSLAAAVRLRHGGSLRGPVLLSLGLPPLLLFGVFTAAPPASRAVALAIALNVLGGVFASLSFALLPRLAPDTRALVRANGLLAQCGASGSLLGPPLMAACVQAGGWTAAAILGAAVSAAAIPLVWRAVGGRR